MDRNLSDFTNRKIVFPDWLHVYAGRMATPREGTPVDELPSCIPRGVALKIFPPQISEKPVFPAEKKWEHPYIAAYCTLLKDEKVHRLYYEVFHQNTRKWSDHHTFLCCAESTDAENWTRPNYGIVEYEGSTDNNIIFTPEMHPEGIGLHGSHVFIDPNAPAEERYKLTYCGTKNRPFGGYSPDGIHWTLKDEPIINSEADSENVVYWDEELKKYVGYFRIFRSERRGIVRGESEDFWHWPDPIVIYQSDPNLPVDADYYTNSFNIWPGTEHTHDAFIMLPAVYHRARDYVDVELYTSRNGIQWFRHHDNPICVPSAGARERQGAIYFSRGFFKDKEGMWTTFCTYYPWNHNAGPTEFQYPAGGFRAARWREDGFVGIDAETFGEFWTVRFRIGSPSIQINALTNKAGWIKVGLFDSLTGRAIDDHGVEDADLLSGDVSWAPLSWHGDSDLSDYDDVAFRLHFQLYQATIFAIRFTGNT